MAVIWWYLHLSYSVTSRACMYYVVDMDHYCGWRDKGCDAALTLPFTHQAGSITGIHIHLAHYRSLILLTGETWKCFYIAILRGYSLHVITPEIFCSVYGNTFLHIPYTINWCSAPEYYIRHLLFSCISGPGGTVQCLVSNARICFSSSTSLAFESNSASGYSSAWLYVGINHCAPRFKRT